MARSRTAGALPVVVLACLVGAMKHEGRAVAQNQARAPRFQVDPAWPKPLPNRWLVGAIAGVAVEDPAQTYLIINDGTNQQIWILRRDTLEIAVRLPFVSAQT